MRFNCGETAEEKEARVTDWHRWFAWYPVRVASGDCRWLEYVERRCTMQCGFNDYWYSNEYRAIK